MLKFKVVQRVTKTTTVYGIEAESRERLQREIAASNSILNADPYALDEGAQFLRFSQFELVSIEESEETAHFPEEQNHV